jgi:hypothetical protein
MESTSVTMKKTVYYIKTANLVILTKEVHEQVMRQAFRDKPSQQHLQSPS